MLGLENLVSGAENLLSKVTGHATDTKKSASAQSAFQLAKSTSKTDSVDFSTSLNATTASSGQSQNTLLSQNLSAKQYAQQQYDKIHTDISAKYKTERLRIAKDDTYGGGPDSASTLKNDLASLDRQENYEYHVLDQLRPTLDDYGQKHQAIIDKYNTLRAEGQDSDNPANWSHAKYTGQENQELNQLDSQMQKDIKVQKVRIMVADQAKGYNNQTAQQIAGAVGIPKEGGFWNGNWCGQFAAMPFRKLFGENAPQGNGSWDQNMIYGGNQVPEGKNPQLGSVVQFHGHSTGGITFGNEHVGIVTKINSDGTIEVTMGNMDDSFNGKCGNGVKTYTFWPSQYKNFGFQDLPSVVADKIPNADEAPDQLPPGY